MTISLRFGSPRKIGSQVWFFDLRLGRNVYVTGCDIRNGHFSLVTNRCFLRLSRVL